MKRNFLPGVQGAGRRAHLEPVALIILPDDKPDAPAKLLKGFDRDAEFICRIGETLARQYEGAGADGIQRRQVFLGDALNIVLLYHFDGVHMPYATRLFP